MGANDLPGDVWTTLVVVLILIVADTLLGVIQALGKRKSNIRDLPRFLQTAVLPYAGGLVILAALAAAAGSPELKALFFTAAVATAAKFLAELKDKVKAIFGLGAPP